MKVRKRLTRHESKEATRARLIEAGEKVFIRRGFEEASVAEIADAAGYTRGAFYSNFADTNELFLAVVDAHRLDVVNALQDILRGVSGGAERRAAVREWFRNQWRMKDFVALRMGFSRGARKSRSIRNRLADLWRQEFESYAACVTQDVAAPGASAAERRDTVALALLAVNHGLAMMAIDARPDMYHLYPEAAQLAFDRLNNLGVE